MLYSYGVALLLRSSRFSTAAPLFASQTFAPSTTNYRSSKLSAPVARTSSRLLLAARSSSPVPSLPASDAASNFSAPFFPSDPRSFLRAVICKPSLLTFDVNSILLRCTCLYERVGIPWHVLGRLLFSRPTTIPCSSLDDQKLDLIRRIGLQPDAALYKYAVSIIANLGRLGLS